MLMADTLTHGDSSPNPFWYPNLTPPATDLLDTQNSTSANNPSPLRDNIHSSPSSPDDTTSADDPKTPADHIHPLPDIHNNNNNNNNKPFPISAESILPQPQQHHSHPTQFIKQEQQQVGSIDQQQQQQQLHHHQLKTEPQQHHSLGSFTGAPHFFTGLENHQHHYHNQRSSDSSQQHHQFVTAAAPVDQTMVNTRGRTSTSSTASSVSTNRRQSTNSNNKRSSSTSTNNNTNKSNKKSKMSDSDYERRQSFLERNRQAACKSRLKKKNWIQGMEQHAEQLTVENHQLQLLVTALQSELRTLRESMDSHRSCLSLDNSSATGSMPPNANPTSAGTLPPSTATTQPPPPPHSVIPQHQQQHHHQQQQVPQLQPQHQQEPPSDTQPEQQQMHAQFDQMHHIDPMLAAATNTAASPTNTAPTPTMTDSSTRSVPPNLMVATAMPPAPPQTASASSSQFVSPISPVSTQPANDPVIMQQAESILNNTMPRLAQPEFKTNPSKHLRTTSLHLDTLPSRMQQQQFIDPQPINFDLFTNMPQQQQQQGQEEQQQPNFQQQLPVSAISDQQIQLPQVQFDASTGQMKVNTEAVLPPRPSSAPVSTPKDGRVGPLNSYFDPKIPGKV